MRVTIVRDDGVVGVNGTFRSVDMSGLPAGVRALQWDGAINKGHLEYDDATNAEISSITPFQVFIDRWTGAAPKPSTTSAQRLIAATHARINGAYEAAVQALTSGYPQNEVASWPKQEMEARAWLAWLSDPTAPEPDTPWIDGAANTRGITKYELVQKIIAQANQLAPLHGALTGKRQLLRDRIDALGPNATAEQLNAIQWNT